MRQEAHVLLGRGLRIALPQQMFGEPGDVRLQRPTNKRPQHLDHHALLSTNGPGERRSAQRIMPDYADLASPKPLRHKGSDSNIGIIRRSAYWTLCRRRHKWHKIRNVRDKLPERLQTTVERRMRTAYRAASALDAEAQLLTLAREL